MQKSKKKKFKTMTCGFLAASLMIASVATAPLMTQAAAPKLNKKSATLTVGKKLTLKVQNAKKGATIKWSSKDKSIASVSAKGVVTAKAVGKTTITAVVSKKTLKCNVTVKDQKNTNTDQNTNADATDISALVAGKSYKGTAVTPMGNMEALSLTFGTDGTVSGSKINETTLTMEQFSGTYKAVAEGKKVTITVEADGKTFSEELTLESDDYTKLSAKKNILGTEITVNVEEVTGA